VKRREFLSAVLAMPVVLRHADASAAVWRTFEITTTIGLEGEKGPARAWLPLPLARPAEYQRNLGHAISGNATVSRVVRDASSGAEFIAASWENVAGPTITVTKKVATTGHAVPLDRPAGVARPADLARYLKPTALIPLDGIVKSTADGITRGLSGDLPRARAIYDWIVEHTVRDPEVKGCGLGDIRWMLESKNLSGKCADLNALFVGLARASGLPARDLYGIRVAPSRQFPSLGRAGGNITTAQHCRAEVFLSGYGWVPVDPADVRKLILEERPQATLSDAYVSKVRSQLFGSWEMNWFAYNDAHDVVLPGASGKPLPFFMYPQAEVAGVRRDSLDPDRFRYTITAREM
jgi:transglutaminase-like putative cysteine protease